MIRYLYINGRLLPNPPSDAVYSYGKDDGVIKLTDGNYHVILSRTEPLFLTVKFPVYENKSTYDSVFRSLDDVVGFISAVSEEPFEFLLLGDGLDLNITAVCTDISVSHKKDKTEITLKVREYVSEAVL